MPNRSSRRTRLGGLALAASLAAVCLLPAGAAQAGSTLPALNVAINATSITVSGATQSGAVNVVSTATGVKQAATILIRLNPGVSPAALFAFLGGSKGEPDINEVRKFGSIVFDAEVTPGQPSEAQTTLEPGEYVALDAPGEGPPKIHSSFTVTAAASPAALPAPGATVKSIEFGFRGPVVLHDGETVRFENEGFLVHMDIAFPVKNKGAAKRLMKDLKTGKEKQAQKLIVGPPVSFHGPLSNGGMQQQTITAKPGLYVQACFMDTQDGRSHTRLGMERVIKIAK